MVKEQIVSEIAALLSEMQLPVETGEITDISVRTDFLDAGWSTGKKKISYETFIFANEQDNTVYMYEKTTEVGKGLSFGGGAGSSFQSGKTLFRKVKNVQYGPDGKAYEIKLDLGAIPKAAKETAKKHGWKFKTVLSKSKALYPEGYSSAVPAATFHPEIPAGRPADAGPSSATVSGAAPEDSPKPRYNDPEKPLYAEPGGKTPSRLGGIVGLVGFVLLGLFLLLLLFAGGAAITGWVLTVALFGGSFYLQRKISRKGLLLNLALLLVAGFLMMIVAAGFSTTDLSSARIKNAQMTTGLEAPSMKPVDKVKAYSVDSPEMIVSAELRRAPQNTRLRFVWTYTTGDIPITAYEMDSGTAGTDIYIYNNIHNGGRPWPQGEYRVDIFIDDREKPDAQVDFEVK
ncbi:MAG TPA: hypothetical protein PLP89_04535 [Synergistales bacterium]|jgi:hypothetical protein|nr:hypothetical protein [Synergistales bacterium]HRV71437.1 hypothetical protein [Thermovirgaceae bacterium]